MSSQHVTTAEISAFFICLQKQIANGEYENAAERFATSLGVYVKDDILVLGSREIIAEALKIYHTELKSNGVYRVEPEICATELPLGRSRMIWLELHHFDRENRFLGSSSGTFILSGLTRNARPQIEMVVFSHLAIPTLVEAFPFASAR